jgi:hypothetical protein
LAAGRIRRGIIIIILSTHSSRRRRLSVLILPVFLLLAGGVGAVAWLGGGSGTERTMNGVSVTVRVRFGTAAAKAPVEKSVSLPPGSSVLDAVRAAGVRVTTTDEAKGESCCGTGMVHALDGVAADETTRSGWMYSVNGMPPSIGPGEMRVGSGDVVEWTYR